MMSPNRSAASGDGGADRFARAVGGGLRGFTDADHGSDELRGAAVGHGARGIVGGFNRARQRVDRRAAVAQPGIDAVGQVVEQVALAGQQRLGLDHAVERGGGGAFDARNLGRQGGERGARRRAAFVDPPQRLGQGRGQFVFDLGERGHHRFDAPDQRCRRIVAGRQCRIERGGLVSQFGKRGAQPLVARVGGGVERV